MSYINNQFELIISKFKTIDPYIEDSYLQYVELLLEGTVQLLIPQADDLILASVILYNDAISDIPVVMDYKITVDTVFDNLAIAETYIDLINNQIKVRFLFQDTKLKLFSRILEHLVVK